MKLERQQTPFHELHDILDHALSKSSDKRVGLLTSITGGEIATLLLSPKDGTAELMVTAVENNKYSSFSTHHAQFHWFERALFDFFGIVPEGHPRFKHLLLHDQYAQDFFPLRKIDLPTDFRNALPRRYEFLEVKGEGVYELPVGPIHAGVIEPGHFRFSCFGETIVNLEIRLGWVHRGVEKRLTEVPWQKAHFVAEAAASDTALANAFAHAIAIESILDLEITERAQYLRTIALEIERLAVHIIDVGGIGTDIGLLGISSAMGRLRGKALALADLISGSRFLRGFIFPGGVRPVSERKLSEIKAGVIALKKDLTPVIQMLSDNQMATERMKDIGKLSKSLAAEFGMVGIIGKACGIDCDTRRQFKQGKYPELAPEPSIEIGGDILARTAVRVGEIWSSLKTIETLVDNCPHGEEKVTVPEMLPANATGLGIVEATRGELIHLIFTDEDGKICRYAIKDPSFDNWTAISIAIRDNLIADFPLCNKSMALSYSGNDL
ncbi:MAG: NADH-quinone oxidoreductase subunit C [Candidatus Obscuribacterales bacterium]